LPARHHYRSWQNLLDGALSEVLDRFADFKIVTVQCSGDYTGVHLEKYGEVVERNAATVKLKVKRGSGHPGVQGAARRVGR